ncbi:MAG TPA: hypothetical protein VI749_09385 [Candidatus Omnitrophota bacterium]|nr:hypothetical protein [Candidatus Omnitrophota bacterium]
MNQNPASSHDSWVAQQAAKIVSEDEKITLIHTPSSQRLSDIFRLVRILSRAFLRYPRACVKALLYSLDIKALDDRSADYEPKDASLKKIFGLFKDGSLPLKGDLVLANEERWNDYLIMAHLFALRLKEQLADEEDIITKARWGLAHGVYNAIVHGDPSCPIRVHWQILPEEFRLQIANTKNEERMKPHNVSFNGIPISGVGGSLVIMRILFDYFNLSEVINAKQEEEIRLTLIHRRSRKRASLRYTMAVRIAHARDTIQLERIWRKKR